VERTLFMDGKIRKDMRGEGERRRGKEKERS
jgi:hypothetical protein